MLELNRPLSRRGFAALVAAIAAAGGATAAGAEGEDATTLLQASAQAMSQITSFKFTLATVEGRSTILNNLELEGVEGAVMRPDRFQATVSAKVAIVTVKVKVVGIGTDLWVTDPTKKGDSYIHVGGGEGSDARQSAVLRALLDPDLLLLEAVKQLESPVIDGEETIDGEKTTRVVGTIDLSTAAKIISATPEAVPEELILGKMPVTMWIDDGNRVMRVEIEGALTVDESPDVVRQLNVFGFDEPVEIDEPVSQ